MEEIKLDRDRAETTWEAIDGARRVLTNGGVVVFPTDTIYGLGANALDERAIAKLFRIKGRDRNKPISILVRDLKAARRVACIDSKAEDILGRIWPGPVTVILRKKDLIPYSLTAGGESVAVRVPADPWVQKLLGAVDFPITATSANLSGAQNILAADELRRTFAGRKDAPDLLLDAGDLASGTPSTIIDLTDIRNPRLVRMGLADRTAIETFINKIIH